MQEMMAADATVAGQGMLTAESDMEERRIRLEQYKLFVQMADATSTNRSKTNTFYVTVHTTLYSAYLLFLIRFFESLAPVPRVLVVMPFLLLSCLCLVWWFNIRSYNKLNAAKFHIVGQLEQKLPEKPYSTEWMLLGEGRDKKRYWPISHLEGWIALTMLACNLATVILLVVNPAA